MPLYEYQCESCHAVTERIQKFSDPPLETCPSCGGRVKKLLSSPAIQFKGTGWYITDYARKSASEGKKAGETASPAATDAAAPAKEKGGSSGGTSDKKD